MRSPQPALLALSLAITLHTTAARADIDPGATYAVDALKAEGLERTEPSTRSSSLDPCRPR